MGKNIANGKEREENEKGRGEDIKEKGENEMSFPSLRAIEKLRLESGRESSN